jgi:hypothetical protein
VSAGCGSGAPLVAPGTSVVAPPSASIAAQIRLGLPPPEEPPCVGSVVTLECFAAELLRDSAPAPVPAAQPHSGRRRAPRPAATDGLLPHSELQLPARYPSYTAVFEQLECRPVWSLITDGLDLRSVRKHVNISTYAPSWRARFNDKHGTDEEQPGAAVDGPRRLYQFRTFGSFLGSTHWMTQRSRDASASRAGFAAEYSPSSTYLPSVPPVPTRC